LCSDLGVVVEEFLSRDQSVFLLSLPGMSKFGHYGLSCALSA
jgi:hypothetical protein